MVQTVFFRLFNFRVSACSAVLPPVPASHTARSRRHDLPADGRCPAEQAGVHGFFQRSLCHIDIRIRRERARFRTAVGVNVEESSSCCQTAAGAFLIAREGDKDHFRMLRAQPLDSRADGLALGVPRGEMLRLIGYRDKLNIKDRFAAAPGVALAIVSFGQPYCLPCTGCI